ncbi:MAG TPA: hypothetical protein VH186_21705 [Chloroflexia bacterium]|nr:hypothetical protein [Chloroflexia bacterium]
MTTELFRVGTVVRAPHQLHNGRIGLVVRRVAPGKVELRLPEPGYGLEAVVYNTPLPASELEPLGFIEVLQPGTRSYNQAREFLELPGGRRSPRLVLFELYFDSLPGDEEAEIMASSALSDIFACLRADQRWEGFRIWLDEYDRRSPGQLSEAERMFSAEQPVSINEYKSAAGGKNFVVRRPHYQGNNSNNIIIRPHRYVEGHSHTL